MMDGQKPRLSPLAQALVMLGSRMSIINLHQDMSPSSLKLAQVASCALGSFLSPENTPDSTLVLVLGHCLLLFSLLAKSY